MLIRVWIRTGCATRSCFETFLSALCHEFCHRLDFRKYGFPDSWHTRGFYERAAALCTPMRGDAAQAVILGWQRRAGAGALIGRERGADSRSRLRGGRRAGAYVISLISVSGCGTAGATGATCDFSSGGAAGALCSFFSLGVAAGFGRATLRFLVFAVFLLAVLNFRVVVAFLPAALRFLG